MAKKTKTGLAPDESRGVLAIRDVDTLKVVADPLRLQILQLLDQRDGPRTVKGLAAALKMPATKLYYHVNLLEEHGLIRVVDTRVVSGIIEKQYAPAAAELRVDQALLTPSLREPGGSFDILLGTMLDTVKSCIRQGLDSGLIVPEKSGEPVHHRLLVCSEQLRLTPKRAAKLRERLKALVAEYQAAQAGADDPGAEWFGLSVSYYPVALDTEGEAAGDE